VLFNDEGKDLDAMQGGDATPCDARRRCDAAMRCNAMQKDVMQGGDAQTEVRQETCPIKCPGKNPDPSKEESWRRCVLRKVETHLWEVMDVTATEVYEVVEDDEDSGPIAEWNMYYRRPTVTSIEKAREDAKAEQIDAMEADEEIMESPRRKRMRGKAFESQQKQAE